MSALRLRRRTSADMGQHWRPCGTPGCIGTGLNDGSRKSGAVQALILGQHADYLCDACAKEWRTIWADMGGAPVENPRERVSYRDAA